MATKAEEAKQDEAKPKAKRQKANGVYYIVNPGGAIHSVDRDHAAWRLRTAGWRLAAEDEITVYLSRETQRSDRPICEPWSPDPDSQLEPDL